MCARPRLPSYGPNEIRSAIHRLGTDLELSPCSSTRSPPSNPVVVSNLPSSDNVSRLNSNYIINSQITPLDSPGVVVAVSSRLVGCYWIRKTGLA